MTYRAKFGKLGEDIACEYLANKGYKIIERNFRKPWGELDIIAKSPHKILVFLEVKTVKQNSGEFIGPEEQLTRAKLEKLKRSASLYAGHNQLLIKDDKGWQIDLLALTFNGESCEIKHYENIS